MTGEERKTNETGEMQANGPDSEAGRKAIEGEQVAGNSGAFGQNIAALARLRAYSRTRSAGL
jgi:hypothetical protein